MADYVYYQKHRNTSYRCKVPILQQRALYLYTGLTWYATIMAFMSLRICSPSSLDSCNFCKVVANFDWASLCASLSDLSLFCAHFSLTFNELTSLRIFVTSSDFSRSEDSCVRLICNSEKLSGYQLTNFSIVPFSLVVSDFSTLYWALLFSFSC